MATAEVSTSSNPTTKRICSIHHGLRVSTFRSTWQALLGMITLGSVVLYFLLTSVYAPFQRLYTPTPSPYDSGERPDGSEFFNWTTTTSFGAVTEDDAIHATIEELCKSFPHDKLIDIQPVLKSGHGAMARVRSQLKGPAACLTNLLIFSDLDEELEGHAVIDTVKDIPLRLIESDNQTLPYRHLQDLAANGTLKDAELSTLQGWETDKFKFLPDVSRAWQMNPEKQWYVFFEGDTYLVWDTIFRLLEKFDPDRPHYFGSPSPGRDGIWFANGGPGFILSRSAMQKLVKGDYERKGRYLGSHLSEKYWIDTLKDCCGDSILGWALSQNKVKLEGLCPMFNPHPPHGMPFADRYWCEPMLSMHKPTEDDTAKLWRWEWQHRYNTRPLLYRDLAVSYYDSFIMMNDDQWDWDNAEWDAFDPEETPVGSVTGPHSSTTSCRTACLDHEGCFQWTYHLGRCHFVRSFRLGRARAPQLGEDPQSQTWSLEQQRFKAGWDTAKIKKWIDDRPCNEVQWVKPSTERIF